MTRPTASTTTARPAATAGTVTRSPLVTTSREPQVIPQPRSPRSHVGPNIEQRPTLVRETGLVCWRLDCGDWQPNRTVRSARCRHGRRTRGARAGHRRRSPQNTSTPSRARSRWRCPRTEWPTVGACLGWPRDRLRASRSRWERGVTSTRSGYSFSACKFEQRPRSRRQCGRSRPWSGGSRIAWRLGIALPAGSLFRPGRTCGVTPSRC
jgi:hypothetical protein